NTNTNNNPYNFQLPENLNLNLNIRIKDLSFNKFNAYMASGKIYLKNKQIIANEVKFNTMDGKVLISGLLDNNRDNKILLSCDATVYDINISKLFYQFNNFGQQNIKYNNINGTLNADIQFAAFCNNSFTIDANTIYVKSSVNIENGQLLNYKPIEGLSKYIKWKDLSNIKFYSLTNQIEVKNRNVYIPQMEIKSSALNLNLWGNHNFDNQIEYHINVSLSDLKKNTAKTTKKEEFGDIEDDGLNKFNYFFLITGTVDNPIYNIIDKQAYKEKIINDIKKEKESLKEILKNEFGLKKNDTLKLNKKEEFKKKQGNDFIYEWEEE
ncbi:MAG TPA: AsmA-like C-terminal region-containing protein, partial [Bacteroidales bacterium]|nr:AsmA-like C-terminal region-containing protein [Bacteroidales bacterium]